MNTFSLLLFVISFLLLLIVLFRREGSEGFTSLEQAMGKFPDAQDTLLVSDTYPPINKNELSNNTSSKIWWHYPTFQLGSYKQITNNIRYSNNPDVGTCMPASMCGAFYHEKKTGSNYVNPLPPVTVNHGTRVGYFTTDETLIDSLPFTTDMQNILY